MSPVGKATLVDRVTDALSCIHDPCSVAAGRPLSIVDLGLVVGASADDAGNVTVVLRTTFPGCTMVGHFSRAAEMCIGALEDVQAVTVEVREVWDWTPAAVTPAGRRALDRLPTPAGAGHAVPWARRPAADSTSRTHDAGLA